MGKDWRLWGRSASKTEKNKGSERERGPPPGCMGSMFQLLNFSNVRCDYFIEDHHFPTKEKTGLEAPRNSLEEEELVKAKDNSPMPVDIRIKTCGGISKDQDNRTSSGLSLDFYAVYPSAKTPNLVARLMGLNHLPENLSPSWSSLNPSKLSKADQKELMNQRNHSSNSRCSFDIDITGSRSLPESPRVSVSRRSDVEHHRLSLQSCKENVSESVNNIISQRKNKKVRQGNVCENLSRDFGMDISNTTMGNKEYRRDNVLLASKKTPEKKSQENRVSNLSLQGVKNMKENVKKKTGSFENKHFSQGTKRIEKPSNGMGKKKEENFVRRSKENKTNIKSKKTPILSVTRAFPLKKEPLSKTKLVSKQESEAHFSKRRKNAPSCLVKPYYSPQMTCHNSSSGVTKAQFHYIIEVLKFLGIDQNSPVFYPKLPSPSHPLHPSVFNFLDLTFSGSIDTQLRHRSNRKLIFDLVEEILVDLNPCLNLKPWVFKKTRNVYQRDGSSLISQLFTMIQSLHATDCRVLKDIDGLIDDDFDKSNFRMLVAFEEESETIVAELESNIMDSLVHDIVLNVILIGRLYTNRGF